MSHRIENVVCLRETSKAILVRFEGGQEEWIPQSQVDDDSEVFALGHEGALVVSDWFAGKRGWT